MIARRPSLGPWRGEPGGGDQGSARQPATLTLAPAHLHLSVGRRIGRDVEQVINGGATQAEDVEDGKPRRRLDGSSPLPNYRQIPSASKE